MNISETLKQATEILEQNIIVEPRREANSLLAFALEKDKTFLIAHSEYELSETETITFEKLLTRRAAHEPLPYIRGHQEFFGLDFVVTPDVLIPRPETELIVEAASEILQTKEKGHFCEIGTGSGCISISILHEVKNATATGADVSENALAITKINAEKNAVADRLNLIESDGFENFENEKFDLVVSNPPYVPKDDFESLQAEVRDFEPHIALTDGKNGLSIIEKIIIDAPRFLKPDCYLLMEIGFNQSFKVEEMFDTNIWQTVEFLPDLQGIPRMAKARLKTGFD
ncbi:MAG: peptide chain release factor N(5)-glutamine methyltransferase [Pyrinomonadaceae bacterium]